MMMFYGTKQVMATPMTRQEYIDYRDWVLPEDEQDSAHEAGYLVEYIDGGPSNDCRHDGYISWSPADVFAHAYQPSGEMSFGHALVALKEGKRVARAGWNGKGMWVILTPGRTVDSLEPNSFYEKSGFKAPVTISSHLDMKAADGSMVIGWLASQTDMLATDWCIVE